MKGKLRNKIFFFMVLVSVVPIVVAGLLSVYSINLSHKIDVANLEQSLINKTATEINSSLLAIFDNGVNIKLSVDASEIQGKNLTLVKIGDLIFPGLFNEKSLDPILDIALLDLEGTEAVRYGRIFPNFRAPSKDLRDKSESEEFKVSRSGAKYASDTNFGSSGPTITLAAPLYTKDGILLGVTAAEISLNRAREIVEGVRLGKSGYVYLVDRGGALIVGSGPFKDLASGTDLKNTRIVSELVKRGKLLALDWEISAALEGAEGAVSAGKDFIGLEGQQKYENSFGEEVVAAGRFLPEYGWGLVAEWPTAEADASVNELIYNNTMISIAVFVIAVVASILLATIIVRPIKALEKGTERVAQGKFDEEIKIRTGDELEELGEAFNKMTSGLKRLEELKEEFVFIAAHELRTPVAAMRGYLSLILDGTTGGVGQKTKEFIEKVIRSNDRLVQLVNDLLEVSRSEAGRLTIKVAPVDIAEPVRQVLSELEKMAEEKKVEMVYEALPNMPKVLADPDRAKEVLVNLVGNAIKYMGGTGRVAIYHEIKNKILVTHVKDTGLGMSHEAQKKLFEKFYRIPREETREVTGTGLGLFIVKEIMEKMGGEVWATSEGEGRGSTFSFSLTLAK